ncbi:hypothetical protein [Paenibacillus sp. MER 99-2]|uniref:hypothetical protein n=1 Tax=Paenibacillus sp. MER 99-2 TaxID=2939572 RepID=UPI00203CD2DE|nr:hypothetical protein [Paenibacillus sp. MER 99-2]MCM3174250.1 hypothetical protein [Paenibacillus sp. MER 99-2]
MTHMRKRGIRIGLGVFVAVVVAILLLLLNTYGFSRDLDAMLTKYNIQPEQVKVVADIDSRTQLVFYEDYATEGLSLAFAQQKRWSSELRLTGGSLYDDPSERVNTRISALKWSDTDYNTILYGKIHDPDITQLKVSYDIASASTLIEANIAPLANEDRLWYVILTKPLTDVKLNMVGLNEAGAIIYTYADSEI